MKIHGGLANKPSNLFGLSLIIFNIRTNRHVRARISSEHHPRSYKSEVCQEYPIDSNKDDFQIRVARTLGGKAIEHRPSKKSVSS